jgi:glycine betaine/proline transport system ATP-binding protein
VTPTTSLSDIISLVVKNPYPVAVVDDAGRLVGSVSRGAVLAALARKGEDTNATA